MSSPPGGSGRRRQAFGGQSKNAPRRGDGHGQTARSGLGQEISADRDEHRQRGAVPLKRGPRAGAVHHGAARSCTGRAQTCRALNTTQAALFRCRLGRPRLSRCALQPLRRASRLPLAVVSCSCYTGLCSADLTRAPFVPKTGGMLASARRPTCPRKTRFSSVEPLRKPLEKRLSRPDTRSTKKMSLRGTIN
jgi:hypothetical protein